MVSIMESNHRHSDEGQSAAQSDLALLESVSKVVDRQAAWPRINPLIGCLVPLVHLSFAVFARDTFRDTFRWFAVAVMVALCCAAAFYVYTRLQVKGKPKPPRPGSVVGNVFSTLFFQATIWSWVFLVGRAPDGLFLPRAAVAYPLTALVFIGAFALVNRLRPKVVLA